MKINNRKKALARQSNNVNNIEQVDEEVKEEAPYFNKRTKTPMLSKKEQFMLKQIVTKGSHYYARQKIPESLLSSVEKG